MALVRGRSVGPGRMVVYLVILLVAVAGWLSEKNALIYTSAAMWFLLVLLPGLIGRLYHRRFMQQQYSAARKLARIISWLHPVDGWRELPEIMRALELAQQGDLTAASETLKRFRELKSVVGLAAIINLYRITNQWEELLAWTASHSQQMDRYPQLLPSMLRARGETGDVRGLVELYDRHRQQIGKLIPVSSRDQCRLMLFAFCGQRQAVEALFAGSLAILPAPIQAFWLATADMAAGASESAKRQLEQLLPAADPQMRSTIERRLSRISLSSEPLDAPAQRVIEEAAREHGHDENFGAQRSLFSNRARATQILIILNFVMFTVEIYFGGGSNPEALYRLGALYPPAVRAGEWWRLVTSLFLHFGALHLVMNMFAMWLLGPFAEFALGSRRFILVYLLTGIGSMGVVVMFGSGPNGEQMTVGASGCIMGIVGATGALMLRGWMREKALAAKRRLITILAIVAMQSTFDSMVPQVSMTAHLSGALIGFVATLILRDRLKLPTTQQSTSKS